MDAPGVFLSHAGEDNDRFARRFAEGLAKAGCRVWFDQWEILPGDSLVDKVFEEGLKEADAMVVVLSANSIDKAWVREELNAGFMKRLEGKCKLIPVILDGVEVPEVLRSTVWQRVDDLNSYDEAFDRVVRAIHDDRHRPAPGAQPRYSETIALPGLYSTDTLVLRVAGEMVVESDGDLVRTVEIFPRLDADDVTEEAYIDSLQVLEEHGYVDVHRTMGSGLQGASSFTVTTLGLDTYATNFVPGYDDMERKVIVELVNTDHQSDRKIASETGVPRVLVEHVFDVLASRGLVKVSKTTGPNSHASSVSPQLRRMLAQNSGNEGPTSA
jgi:hypothetical protein